MVITNNSGMTDCEVYELSYTSFLDALKILAENAESQCQIMDYYNVAWELKDDVLTGECLLEISNKRLTDELKKEIKYLLSELKELPEELFVSTTNKSGNLKAMHHNGWEPIRRLAKNLIQNMAG